MQISPVMLQGPADLSLSSRGPSTEQPLPMVATSPADQPTLLKRYMELQKLKIPENPTNSCRQAIIPLASGGPEGRRLASRAASAEQPLHMIAASPAGQPHPPEAFKEKKPFEK